MLAHHSSAPTDILLVLVPLVGLGALLYLANRRAQRLFDARTDRAAVPTDPNATDPNATDPTEAGARAADSPT